LFIANGHADLGVVATVAAVPGSTLLFPDALSLREPFGSSLQSTERATATSED
jgi:hypothetical protein